MKTALAREIRDFLADHLPRVRGASAHTVLAYRDALALLLRFLAARHRVDVVDLDFRHLAPEDVLAFLEHLELVRGNAVVTRNARLAAIHAFARHAAAGDPARVHACQALIAVPFKRAGTRVVDYLDGHELRALLDAPDRATARGRRDHALLLTMFNTGARVQEIVDLRVRDVRLERPHQVLLHGKGGKERVCPIWSRTVSALCRLLEEEGRAPDDPDTVFLNRRRRPLTRFGVRYLLDCLCETAKAAAPSLATKRVHPHTIRHTTAVHLLRAGVDIVTISHWLGHADVETTNRYLAVDLATKRQALARAEPLVEFGPEVVNWRTDASILAWLEAL